MSCSWVLRDNHVADGGPERINGVPDKSEVQGRTWCYQILPDEGAGPLKIQHGEFSVH